MICDKCNKDVDDVRPHTGEYRICFDCACESDF